MKSAPAAPSQIDKMRISSQVVILVTLLVSTVIVTRMVVLSTVVPDTSTSREFQFTEHAATCTSQPSKNTDSRFHDEPAEYTPYRDGLESAPFELHGYILSMKKERYEYASGVLAKLQITPHHYVPYPYTSPLVWDEMQKYNNGSLEFHRDEHNLKMFSHRMAHTSMLFDFVRDSTAKMNSWRFFFEDDIEIHPKVSVPKAQAALAKALQVGAADGIIYLGICGPGRSKEAVELAPGITARRSHGTCTHAYGVTKWRAAALLTHIDTVRVPKRYSRRAYLFFDILTRAYGMTVTKAYVVGWNLKSPVPHKFLQHQRHVGLVFQDRVKYPSFISPRNQHVTHADPPL